MTTRIPFAMLAVALLASPILAQGSAGSPEPLKVGSTVDASLVLKDVNGKVHAVKDLRGKLVVISFWSILCPTLKVAEPKIQQIHDDYVKKGVIRYAGGLDNDPLGNKGADAMDYVRDAIESLLTGKDVQVTTSRPYG